jgi:hypothetical protein
MPNLISTTNLRQLPMPSVPESEASTALNIARARTLASERLLDALESNEPITPASLKLCIDTLKLSVDRAAAPPPASDHTSIAPELQRTLEGVLRLAGDAFRIVTDPDGGGS